LGFVSCDIRSFNTLMRIKSRGPPPVRVRIYLSPGKDPNGIVRIDQKDEDLKRFRR
jgi:hypothetical protein